MNDGYVDWLALAPEGKFPVRTETKDQPSKFTDAWNHLKTGVDRRKPRELAMFSLDGGGRM